MKYLVSLLLGMLTGFVLTVLLVYFNPLGTGNDVSPLAVTENRVVTLNYSAIPADSLLYTNNGEARIRPHPAKVLQLWEPPIRSTAAMVSVLADSLGRPAGIGVKFSSDSEETSLLDTAAMVDSVWHIYLPGEGSLFIEQTENYWSYLRNVVVPAYWSTGDNWKGVWRGNITAGPNALGTARVTGGSGIFAGMETEAVEALNARAYAVERGPVAMEGQLIIEMPGPAPDERAAQVDD